MHQRVCIFLLSTVFWTPACLAQKWAADMFGKIDHDFGTVARGADTVHRFEITNKYKEDIRLLGVRSSCGCTTPSLENQDLKTWEKGYVIAKFNTRTFTGIHSATLTVDIEVRSDTLPPYRGQVQLRVHGNIRGDIVFEPGAIVFGEVDQGQGLEKKVSVSYSGRSGWRIEDVRSASDSLEVELTERQRSGGRVVYDLMARLKEGAAPGLVKEQLVIVTNDSNNPRVPLDVEARVIPEISVAPANLVFGKVLKGEEANKRMIVRGKTPFRVIAIECKDDCFQFSTDQESKDRHIINVVFDAKCNPGDLKAPIVIKTDRGASFIASCVAYATVEQSEAPLGPEETSLEGDGAQGERAANNAQATAPATGGIVQDR